MPWQNIFDAARIVAEPSNSGSRNRWVTLSLPLRKEKQTQTYWYKEMNFKYICILFTVDEPLSFFAKSSISDVHCK